MSADVKALLARIRSMNPALVAARIEFLKQVHQLAVLLTLDALPEQPITTDFLVGVSFGSLATMQKAHERGGLDDLNPEDEQW